MAPPAKKMNAPHSYALEPGSLIGSILLFPSFHGSLSWRSAIKGDSAQYRLFGSSGRIFPDTRPAPLISPVMSHKRRVEHGAHFMRTYFPDVDIPINILEENFRDVQGRTYDPYLGNRLASCLHGRQRFLAFPMGEVAQHLNISPFQEREGRDTFTPSATPAFTFNTSIHQIQSAALSAVQNALIVRTVSSTHFFSVSANPHPSQAVKQLDEIDLPQTRGRRISDVAINPFEQRTAIAVSDTGTLYFWNPASDGRTLSRLSYVLGEDYSDPFWRVSWLQDNNAFLLANHDRVKHLDMRNPLSAGDVYRVNNGDGVLTSIESPQSHLWSLCTTKSVLWIDTRKLGTPVLSWAHKRQPENTLESRTVAANGTLLTFLTSRDNGLITIYDVSSTAGTVQSSANPTALIGALGGDFKRAGWHLMPQQDNAFTLAELSSRGGLFHRTIFQGERTTPTSDTGATTFHWSAAVRALDRSGVQEDLGPLAERTTTETDLSRLYQHVSQRLLTADGSSNSEFPDIVRRFWGTRPPGDDTIWTIFDATHLSSPDPNLTPRADFLTNNKLASNPGTLHQNDFPALSMQDAAWSFDLSSLRCPSSVHQFRQPPVMSDNLKQFHLVDGPTAIESDCSDQLATDLALSRAVGSNKSLLPLPLPRTSSSHRPGHVAARTDGEADIPQGEPPSFQFGYLKISSGGGERSPGPRLLLSDWIPGTKGRDYIYHNPYDGGLEAQSSLRSPNVSPIKRASGSTQVPPTIVTMSKQQPHIARVRLLTPGALPNLPQPGSQPLAKDSSTSYSQPINAQELIPSTQILPGPFGGRPNAKKLAKKRMGGF